MLFVLLLMFNDSQEQAKYKYTISAEENVREYFIGCWGWLFNCGWPGRKRHKPTLFTPGNSAYQCHPFSPRASRANRLSQFA